MLQLRLQFRPQRRFGVRICSSDRSAAVLLCLTLGKQQEGFILFVELCV